MTGVFTTWKRSGAGLPIGAMTMLLLGACDQGGGANDLANTSAALRCPEAPGDGDCPWKVSSRLLPANGASADIVHEQAPALCGNNQGAMVVSVESGTHKYRALQLNCGANANVWSDYAVRFAQNKTFASKPACTFRENVGSNAGFVLAGKGTDGKIYASPGALAPNAFPQGNPTASAGWSLVANDSYTSSQSSPAGAPALVTGGFTVQKITLVNMGNDLRTIYAYVHPTPYTMGGWSGRITGPALPAGWVAQGPPAIVAEPVVNYIGVHARNGSQDRLFITYFYSDGQYFSNSTGSPVPGWSMESSNLGSMDGGPSITSSDLGKTIWFLHIDPLQHINQILETTEPFATNSPIAVAPQQGFQYASGPSGSSGWGCDSQGGTYHVVARTTSNQLVISLSMPDNRLVP
jgi:hypothetical protein